MNRLYTHYGGHVEDLSQALKDNSSDDAREALSLLQSDGVAQVMSFMNEGSLFDITRTLSAASPEMRLDVDVLTSYHFTSSDCVRVRVVNQRPVFYIKAIYRQMPSLALLNSLWWAERRGMVVNLDADNACSVLLGLLSNRLRGRVEALNIRVDERTVCARDLSPETESAAAVCDGECGTLLCALSTFPNLTSFSILGIRGQASERVGEAVRSALSAAAEMQISDIKLRSVKFSRDFSMVPLSPRLCCLTVHSCGIQSFAGLERYTMLTYLNVSYNSDLLSLHGLAGAQSLEKVVARDCNLQDVEGLSQCRQLREIDVSYNSDLRSLHGLAGAPQLEEVVAMFCNLQDVDGLSQCLHLREIDVSFNSALRSLQGLAGAPKLEKIVACQCGLQDVDGLSQCLHLREIDASSNIHLRSLRGLAGAPSLEKVVAQMCNFPDMKGLSRCRHLREIDVSRNRQLRSLIALAGAPRLGKIVAHQCGLQELKGLRQCPQLREIYVTENSAPLDLRDLEGASRLQLIVAGRCVLLGGEELRSCLPGCKLFL